jgi:thimet oligopeptidase
MKFTLRAPLKGPVACFLVMTGLLMAPWPSVAGVKRVQAPVDLPVWNATTIKTQCAPNLARVKQRFQAIESGRGDVLAQMNALNMLIEDLSGPLYILSNVSPDKATRDAAEECTVKWAPLETEIYQSEKIFKRIKAHRSTDLVQSAYQQELIQGFEDSGVALPKQKRERVKAIIEQIAKLAKDFEKNIRDTNTKVLVTASELDGVPPEVYASVKPDEQGRYALGLEYPTYLPVMENAKLESTREKMWRAKVNEGGRENLTLLDQITVLRREVATLYGYESYAAFSLRRKMARNPETVLKFLAQVKDQVTALEAKEVEELRVFKSEQLKQSLAQTKVNRWDLVFLQEQLKRQRYKVNQEEIRQYFPTEVSVQFMLKLSERLYGLEFKPRKAEFWHNDVRLLDVFDSTTKQFIGSVYLDLFPREGKYNHAAVWPIRNASSLVGRTPIPVLVTNLNRTGLTQDELETLLHEFGHALHGVLSVARYNAQAGTSVMRDFVEAPSQMFEEWARRPEPLQFFASLCSACPQLSLEQIAAFDKARKFGKGIHYARQWVYAAFDMALTHDPKVSSAIETWAAIERSTPLGHVEGTLFPAGFGHLVGGYAAGYYGYMWSEVMALDMLSAFGGQFLNQEVGRRYRQTILAQGGQQPPHKLVEAFLGRAANSDAFFKEITGQR